jgi:hypothetical protein
MLNRKETVIGESQIVNRSFYLRFTTAIHGFSGKREIRMGRSEAVIEPA